MSSAFKQWMKAATRAERRALVERGGTSRQYLLHIKNKHRTPTPAKTRAIVEAANAIRAERKDYESKNRLPFLTVADLNPICAKCPYFLRCKGLEADG